MSERPPLPPMTDREIEEQIARVRNRLTALERERAELGRRLDALEGRLTAPRPITISPLPAPTSPVTAASPTSEKIQLFRRLFVGRADLFPVRWDNRKTGKSGYAPACANEWQLGAAMLTDGPIGPPLCARSFGAAPSARGATPAGADCAWTNATATA
jgi:hypothetical protein